MSKRFGRNQKRKLREKVENLNEARQLDKALLYDIQGRHGKAVRQVERMLDIIEGIFQNSTALPPKTEKGNIDYQRYILPIYEPMKSFGSSIAGTVFDQDTLSYKIVDLYKLETFLEENVDTFSMSAHLRFYNGGESVYYISEAGLRSMPDKILIDQLIPEITKQLVYYMKKG